MEQSVYFRSNKADFLEVTADKKSLIRDDRFYAMMGCMKKMEGLIRKELDRIRSKKRIRRKNRLLRELTRKLHQALKDMESEISGGRYRSKKGTEFEGLVGGFVTGRHRKARKGKDSGKTQLGKGSKKLKAITRGGILFDEEDFGVITQRSRFDSNLGIIYVNTGHPDYKKRVLLPDNEEIWVDYYYKLAVKELTAHVFVGNPALSEDLERMVDLQLRMEESPPKLGVLMKRRGRPKKA